MIIADVVTFLEGYAPVSLQESYDNAGLLIGEKSAPCTGILTCLDVTEEVLDEAISKKCNLIVAHHPLIFRGIKKLSGGSYVERTVIKAIRNDLSVYAIHTNLDHVIQGVNARMAATLGLNDLSILVPKEGVLEKLVTFVPTDHAKAVRNALFSAGAGKVGGYSECSFSQEGKGTFTGEAGTQPFVGEPGKRHTEPESRIEVIFPAFLQSRVIGALLEAHPYEEVAYDIYALANKWNQAGSGMIGLLPQEISEEGLLSLLKEKFGLAAIRHTPLLGGKIRKVALCGGAGSFLTGAAKAAGAQAFITSDIKYHEFFDADGALFLADIGHYESEQFTIDLLADILRQKFPNFAVLKTEVITNPVRYFL
jgi:dinuclear metal center YbgI/SA1388 family protein